jgi:hypothetical protein
VQFGIVRVYQSYGAVDPNGAQTIKNARSAGIPYVDGYIFPCYPVRVRACDPEGAVRIQSVLLLLAVWRCEQPSQGHRQRPLRR